MRKPLSRWFRHHVAAARRTGERPVRRSRAAVLAVAGVAAAVFAPGLLVTPAAAAPTPEPAGRTPPAVAAPTPEPAAGTDAAAGSAVCAGFGAAAAGDLVMLRLLDLRPLGLPLPALTNVRLATTRAGFSGDVATTAAQSRYVDGTAVFGFSPPLGPIDAEARRLAPPAEEPVVVNPTQLNLGPVRAGSGNLTARAAYGRPGQCDHLAGAESEASAGLTDMAVLPARRTLVGVADNQSTRSRTGLVRYQGRTGAEAATTSGLARLAIFEALKLRVFDTTSLRVVAAGSAAASTVEYHAPLIGVDLPDGRSVQLDQAGRSVDFAVPAAGTQPVPGLPTLPNSALPDLLGALPGGAAAVPALGGVLGGLPGRGLPGRGLPGGKEVVPPSAGSVAPPSVPGLPALIGVPAVGGLLGGVGSVPTTAGQSAIVLRLTGGELSKEVADSGVHAKAITLRLKLLLVRGDDVTTLIDLCIGVLEVAATAPGATSRDEGRGRGSDGYGGDEPDDAPTPADTPKPKPTGGVAGTVPAASKLPLTGTNLTAVLIAGVVLLLGGRLLMVLARRRTG
jgi:LPXTG-motif cell wall-anchored protein